MAYQTGKDILVAYKAETTFNTPPSVVTGANQFRLNSSGGLKLGRARINPGEVRRDGQTAIGRLGSRSVTGSYSADLSVGTFDPLFEALLRGTWATGVLLPGATPVRRSFAFEQNEQDIDETQLFTGCRVSSARISLAPDAMATVEFGIVGADMELLTGAAAPFYTAPTLTTSVGLEMVTGNITLGGVAQLDFTACEFTIDLRAAGKPVIGSQVTPDVFESSMTIEGSISCLRKDATKQQAFLAETELALVLALAEPSPGTGTLTFTLPKIKFTDYSANLGDDGAMVATLPFMAGYDATTGGMIKIASAA